MPTGATPPQQHMVRPPLKPTPTAGAYFDDATATTAPERGNPPTPRCWAPWVLTTCSVALLVAWSTGVGRVTDRWWAAGLLVLAWAEFINYSRVQLMHDTRSDLTRLIATRRLRRSWLAIDLAGWRESTGVR